MSKKYIGIIVLVLVVFGGAYLISRPDTKPTSQSNTTGTDSPVSGGKSVDLSGHQLTTLPDDVLQQTTITNLNVSNNQMTTLPAAISNLTNLEVLNVENNRLQTFPSEISKLTKLREIHANNNRMENLPDSLSTMTWLKVLDISGNSISASDIDHLKAALPNTQIKS